MWFLGSGRIAYEAYSIEQIVQSFWKGARGSFLQKSFPAYPTGCI